MNIIILFIIPFCFGFIIFRASENGDMVTTTMALVGIITDLMLIILERGQ